LIIELKELLDAIGDENSEEANRWIDEAQGLIRMLVQHKQPLM